MTREAPSPGGTETSVLTSAISRSAGSVDRFRVLGEALRRCNVLLPAPFKGPSGGEILLTTTQIGNSRVLLAFSSESALLQWKPRGSAYALMRGSDVLDMFLAHDHDLMIIDVAGPHPCTLNRSAIRQILRLDA